MSVGVYIVGKVDFDNGKFKDMFDLKRLCDKQEMEYPQKLKDFFDEFGPKDWDGITDESIKDRMGEMDIKKAIKGSTAHEDGAIINLADLPKDIKSIRVYMS
jgi:hypothetical protein